MSSCHNDLYWGESFVYAFLFENEDEERSSFEQEKSAI